MIEAILKINIIISSLVAIIIEGLIIKGLYWQKFPIGWMQEEFYNMGLGNGQINKA